jgi:hypothetical protein
MFHVIPCDFKEPITHIRFRPIPGKTEPFVGIYNSCIIRKEEGALINFKDGGVQQLIVKGKPFKRENNVMIVAQDKPASSSKKRNRNSRPSKDEANTPKRKSNRLRKQTIKYSPTYQ